MNERLGRRVKKGDSDAPALSLSLQLFPLWLPEVLGRVEPSPHSCHVSPAVNRMHSELLRSKKERLARSKQNKRKKSIFPQVSVFSHC